VGVAQISVQRRRVTDGNFVIAFFAFHDYLSVKSMLGAKPNLQKNWSESNTFNICIPYMKKE
jgi:hypothetical protein